MVQTSLSFMAIQALAEIHRVFNRAEMSKQDPCLPIVKEIMHARDKVIVLHGLGREGLIIRGFAMRLFHLGLRKVHMFGDMCTPLVKAGDLLIVTSGSGWPSSLDPIIAEATASGARALVITAKADGAAAALATTVALVPALTMADPDFPAEGSVEAHPECSMMVEGKMPWQLAHSNQKAPQVPAGDPMAAPPPGKPKLTAKLDEMIERGSQRGSLQLGASFRGSQSGISLYPPEPARFIVTDNKILPMGSAYEGALFVLFEIVVYTLREKLQETLPVMRGRNTNLDHFPPDHACGPPPPTPPPTPPGECGRYHKHPPTSDSGLPVRPFAATPES
jgi:D-arabinose 5-phosphate isomerase GutQ